MSSCVTAQKEKTSAITLKGSAEIVSEFFLYGINSILYQRGIYPAESFERANKYGLTVLLTTDKMVLEYLGTVLTQITGWLESKEIDRLVVVISNVDTEEVMEKWEFKIQYDKPNTATAGGAGMTSPKKETSSKELKEIQKEIRDVIRQITASVTFLPLLDCVCSFDLVIYTKVDLDTPAEWNERGPCIIPNSEEVKLRSFSTRIHNVEGLVSYKAE